MRPTEKKVAVFMNPIESEWTFFSNHAHVLVCLAQNPGALIREVADRVGVTERTAMRLIARLEEAGILKRVKQGRRNFYQIETSEHLRHPLEAHCTIDELLTMISKSGGDTTLHRSEDEILLAGSAKKTDTLKKQTPRESRK